MGFFGFLFWGMRVIIGSLFFFFFMLGISIWEVFIVLGGNLFVCIVISWGWELSVEFCRVINCVFVIFLDFIYKL